MLQKAGYRFRRNELTYQTWMDLSIVHRLLEK